MENHILADRIANAIMMDKSFKGYYLIVEGVKDYKLYSKFTNNSNVKIKEAFGFEKVKLVLHLLSERGFSNKLGIIDSDFSKLLGIKHEVDGLFITDSHDIEVMIFKTKALETVLRIFVSATKISNYEKKVGKSIRDKILEIGIEIGYLKLANKVYNLGLVFKPATVDGNQIKYRDFINDERLDYNGRKSLVNSLINYSRVKSKSLKSEDEIMHRLEEIASGTYDIEHLVNGHDLSNILFLLLKKTLASTNRMLQDFNSVEDSLILSFEYDDFKRTDLYKDIKKFENNANYQILR
jgi:hypothetical protein